MNPENFEKFNNRPNQKMFKSQNGKKRNQRERRNNRYQVKNIINDLIINVDPVYNKPNHNDEN